MVEDPADASYRTGALRPAAPRCGPTLQAATERAATQLTAQRRMPAVPIPPARGSVCLLVILELMRQDLQFHLLPSPPLCNKM